MTNTETPILQPVDQIIAENQEAFKQAGITNAHLATQLPNNVQPANKEALAQLNEQQREAVEIAQREGYFITVAGQTFQPTEEGVNRRQKREALTQAATNGGRKSLVNAGLWDENTNLPRGLDRLHKATSENADLSSSNEDDKTAEALLKGYRVEGNWWERNKNWVQPLLIALAGTALGFALSKCLGSNDGGSAATTLIEKTLESDGKNPETEQTQSAQQAQGNQQQKAETPTANATNALAGASQDNITAREANQAIRAANSAQTASR